MRSYVILVGIMLLLLVGCQKEEDVKGIVSFVDSAIEVSESNTESVEIRLGINRINHDGGTVDIIVEGGEYGEDYETSFGSASTTLNIPAASISEVVTIQPIDNDVEEDDKVLLVILDDASGDLFLGSRPTLTFTILDDDAILVTTLDFTADTVFIDENTSTSANVTIMFDRVSVDGGTIELTFDGSAVMGEDYRVNEGADDKLVLTIGPGANQARFLINAIDNNEMDGDREIKVQFGELSETFELGVITEKVIVIRDDE
ncbi:Calx-beta domain-containing protein [Portibacter marinus]|uniref:Calx-beta domain-containing protein n=1 Tax=Portibacter marinus TaxID=2898660 RepID=UPI001F213325|nr:Calx-beta domain-containing protein [Portibacter marinus]